MNKFKNITAAIIALICLIAANQTYAQTTVFDFSNEEIGEGNEYTELSDGSQFTGTGVTLTINAQTGSTSPGGIYMNWGVTAAEGTYLRLETGSILSFSTTSDNINITDITIATLNDATLTATPSNGFFAENVWATTEAQSSVDITVEDIAEILKITINYEEVSGTQTAATPTFKREGDELIISTETEGAYIYFTTDGSDPVVDLDNPSGNNIAYTPTYNSLIRAVAAGPDFETSEEATYYVDWFTVGDVAFSYNNLRLTMTTTTADATIYYTTDGTDPTDTLASQVYTEPLELTADCTIRAFAVRDGYNPSAETTYNFMLSEVTATMPSIIRTGNTITIETPTTGATIYYTLDGTTPTTASTEYTAPFELTGNCHIQAIAAGTNYYQSEVAELAINDFKVSQVMFSYENMQLVMTTTTEGATIYYTTDNNMPSAQTGTEYTGPVTLDADCTVQAIAVREGWEDSDVSTYEFSLSDVTAATPQILLTDATITIETATAGASIYYTLDGSTPTTASTLYEGPFIVDQNYTIQAIAAGDGLYQSEVATLQVDLFKASGVTFSMEALQLVMSTDTENATIYYTTDNTIPSATNGTAYTTPVTLDADCTVQAIAVREGWTASDVSTFTFARADYTAATPQILLSDRTVTIETATAGASIYYTTDGSTPTTASTLYEGPFLVDQNYTIRAIAAGSEYFTSEVGTYVVDIFKASGVTFHMEALQLVMSTDTENSVIYYTTDNTIPSTTNGTVYYGPVTLDADCTVQAIAVRSGWTSSDVATFTFARADYTAATPQILLSDRTITIETATAGASIYYALDGTTPTTASTLYEGPFLVDQNYTIQAIAAGTEYFTSEVGTYSVDLFKVADVTFSYENFQLTLATETEGAQIRYTLDGTDPTPTTGNVYSAPLDLTEDCTVKAIATAEGWTSSEVTTYQFVLSNVTTAKPNIVRSGSTVTLETATEGATIYYTLDGTEPNATTGLAYTEPITLTGNCVILAIATAPGLYDSEIATLEITDLKVADVAFHYENLQLTLTTTTEDATIYYTMDGSNPTAESTVYTAPIDLTADCVVNAIAMKNGWTSSNITSYTFTLADVTAAAPTISVENNIVTINTTSDGAAIYYTTDGTTPTTASPLYTAPFEVNANCVVQAIAGGTGYNASNVTEYVIDWFRVETVEFNYENLQLTLSTTTPEATIYYTTNGTTPTTESSIYNSPLELTADCKVQAIAVRAGWTTSQLTSYDFVLADVTVATPQIVRSGKTIAIETTTANATIYYTLDGTTPTAESPVYNDPFEVDGNCTVKAWAVAQQMYPSEVASLVISDFQVADVEFFYEHLQLMLTSATEGATIYYTTDGTTPTTNSTVYTNPLELTSDCLVRAIAVREGWVTSNVTSYSFRLADVTVATPQIVRNGNVITITTATAGAAIYYTTDGTEPDAVNGTAYTAAFELDGNCTVRAIAVKDESFTSAEATYTVDWFQVANVTFSLDALMLTMTSVTPDAQIYYTLDGTTPTTSRDLYVDPIPMRESCDVRAIAVREGWYDSEITLFHFNASRNTAGTPQFVRNGNTLTVTSSTTAAHIYYTTDGTVPTEQSNAYDATTGIVLDGNCTVKAIALSDVYLPSAVATYEVDWFQVSNVDYAFDQTARTLTMTTTTPDAAIFYTLDGTTPTTNSTQYTEPLTLTANCDVRARAFRDNWLPSQISLYHYTLGGTTTATPEFSRNGDELTITSATENAEIYYTLDGTTPTTNSIRYNGPITLVENGIVKAIALAPDYLQSGVANFTVNWFRVSNILFNFANQRLSMITATPGTTIYYTLDGTEPTTSSSIYQEPLRISTSCMIQAFGTHPNMMDSNISRYEIDLDHLSTATPIIERVGNTLVITCATAGATIYYTTDGTVPTAQTSHIYDQPIVLTKNCTVRAIAVTSGYRDSGVADYTTDTFRVDDVHIEFVDGFLYLYSETPNATIYYTLDGTAPNSNSEIFDAPIFITERLNVKAIAVKEGFTSSAIISAEVDPNEVKCVAPTFALNDHLLTISSLTDAADIYYTLDGSVPNVRSTRYTGPVTITHNCNVKAIVIKENYRNSDIAALVIDDFQVELPAIAYDGTNISISTLTDGATLYYTTDGSEPTTASAVYSAPFAWDGTSTIQVIGVADNFHSSVVTTFNPATDTCEPVTITYDGHSFTANATDGAEIYYTLDGSNPTTSTFRYTGRTALDGLCTIRAIAVKAGANSSAQSLFELPCHFDGETAIVREAGSLSKALEWYDQNELKSLTVLGNINETDFAAVRAATALHTLDIKQVAVADGILPDQVFAGANFVGVEMPTFLQSVGEELFMGCENLAAITWNVDMPLTTAALRGVDNPNLLLYVSRSAYAPATVRNVITGRRAQNIVLNDAAADANGNFFSIHPFYAERISYTHEYTQQSGRSGESRGWETLALPFNVSYVRHETNGLITPFADQRESSANLPRFWLYTLTENGLARADEIEANTPYVISMPNHEDYADRYNLGGNVTFEARNTTVSATESKTRDFGRIVFVPNFERVAKSPRIFTINKGEPSGLHLEGSIFLADLRDAQPFEAYTVNSDASVKAINLFDIESGINSIVQDLELGDEDLQHRSAVYDLTGRKVSTTGDTQTLKKGIYIINGKKHLISK